MPTHLVAHLLFLQRTDLRKKKSKVLPSQHKILDGNTRQTSTIKKNNESQTALWQKSGFCGYIKFCASKTASSPSCKTDILISKSVIFFSCIQIISNNS